MSYCWPPRLIGPPERRDDRLTPTKRLYSRYAQSPPCLPSHPRREYGGWQRAELGLTNGAASAIGTTLGVSLVLDALLFTDSLHRRLGTANRLQFLAMSLLPLCQSPQSEAGVEIGKGHEPRLTQVAA